jgi:phosphoribosylformylglycinamidine synthase subunit PurQ / glutaminase
VAPKILILSGYGINSEEETKHAFDQSGGATEIVHLNDLIQGDKKMSDYQIMVFPGGFSYSDETGSGNAYANKFRNHLMNDLIQFIKDEKLILAICNGFQIAANLGLFPTPGVEYGTRQVALKHNIKARLESRQINMINQTDKCVLTKGINNVLLTPISHGEGNFYTNPETLQALKDNDQIVFRYCNVDGALANGEYPTNPNGSLEDIAGICDYSGRHLGLMPHPERMQSFYNRELWTLEREVAKREGIELKIKQPTLKIFENTINYFK